MYCLLLGGCEHEKVTEFFGSQIDFNDAIKFITTVVIMVCIYV